MRGPSHSGADIWFSDTAVVKRGRGAVAERLRDQASMFEAWRSPVEGVRVPTVDLIEHDDGEVELAMERIAGPGLAIACDNWRQHMQRLLLYVTATIEAAAPQDVTGKATLKADSVELAIREAHGEIAEVEEALRGVTTRLLESRMELPVGEHHGDLTLCNVLCDCAECSEGDIALVDLSRVYIGSPVLDLAKIRQDSRSRWVRLFVEGVDSGRLLETDMHIVRQFSHARPTWLKWLGVLETLQILRILPYAAPGRVIEWAKSELRREPWSREALSY